MQHSGCRACSQAAGCKKGGSPEGTQHRSIFRLRAARVDEARTMNTTYRWALDVNPCQRLESCIELWTLLGATALKNVTRTSASPSMRRHPPRMTCERARRLANWNISVVYTMIPARHRTHTPSEQSNIDGRPHLCRRNNCHDFGPVTCAFCTGFTSVDVARLKAATIPSTSPLY